MHMTGGTATHDMIVWGPTVAEQQRRKAAADPLLRVPISSELGCITPWVVFPGAKWEQPELLHHARALAIAFMDNNSCNCLSPKVRCALSTKLNHWRCLPVAAESALCQARPPALCVARAASGGGYHPAATVLSRTTASTPSTACAGGRP